MLVTPLWIQGFASLQNQNLKGFVMFIVSVLGLYLNYFPFVFAFSAGCIHFHASSSFSTIINETTKVCAFICNVNIAAWMFPGATASVTVGTHLLLFLLVLHPLYSCWESSGEVGGQCPSGREKVQWITGGFVGSGEEEPVPGCG